MLPETTAQLGNSKEQKEIEGSPLRAICNNLCTSIIHEILYILVTLVAEDKRQVCDSKMVAKEKVEL